MFNFFKKIFNKKKEKGFLTKAFSFLSKNSNKEIKQDLEKILYSFDLSSKMVSKLLENLNNVENIEEAKKIVFNNLKDFLSNYERKIEVKTLPYIMMLVGVNGVGKTTSAAKIANYFKTLDKKVMLIGADTFRAAAVEQLKMWSDKIKCEFFSKGSDTDPGANAFQGLKIAKEKKIDVVIIDTGGRLHNKENLMNEIVKVKKASEKSISKKIDDVIIVVDATQGQNIKKQGEMFHNYLGLTGAFLTKFDGTAVGGAVLDLVLNLNIPIFFLGVGEKYTDIKPFDSRVFVSKLL
jgi:fused signal recognition particle receptor